jgi:hypothetical protein
MITPRAVGPQTARSGALGRGRPELARAGAVRYHDGLLRAKVAELADALDLGSSPLRAGWGFESPPSHQFAVARTGAGVAQR